MKRLLTAALTLALAGACSKQEPAPTTTTAAAPVAPAEPAPAEVLTIVPATLTVVDPARGADVPAMTISITETGEIQAGGQAIGTVTPEGRLLDVGGNEIVAVAADGSVTANGQVAPLTLREDGSIDKDGTLLWTIAEDGTVGGELMSQAPEGTKATYSGDAAGRRAMSLVWLASLLSQPVEGAPAPAPAPTPAPTPGE